MASRSPNPTQHLEDLDVGGTPPPPMLPDNQLGLEDIQTPLPSPLGGGDRQTPGTAYYERPNEPPEAEPLEASGTKIENPANEKPEVDEEEEGVEVPTVPPVLLSKAAANARLRRICTINSKGEYKVPKEVIEQYLDVKKGREDLMKVFERCGHESDRAHVSKKSCYI